MSYTKPVLLQNDDLAEGVYAASGDGQPSIKVVFTGNFGMDPKESRFNIYLSGDLGVQVEVTLEFDKPFTDFFIGGGDNRVGNTVTINNPKNEHWLHVQGDYYIQCIKATVRKTLQTWG